MPVPRTRLHSLLRLAAFVAAGALSFGRSSAQQPDAGSWAVGSAPARFTVELDKDSRPAPLTYTDIEVPYARWVGLPIRVFDANGQAVASEVISTAAGEPTVIAFDSSSGTSSYDIYFGATDWPPLPLKDDKQGVWLESREGDGKEIDKLPDMLDAWNKATKIEGRTTVPGIFEGGNRFGPEKNLLLHFTGYFTNATPEHLDFAVMSTDSSFVLVDGKEVVEWPGAHDVWGGMQAQHQGGVDVPAGKHTLDYYNDYFQPGGPPLLVCLAAKGGPMDKWQMMQPNNPLFTPTDHAHVTDYAFQGTTAPQLAVDWVGKDQSVVSHASTDTGFITLTLTCRPPQDGTVTWTFDDGTTATGETVDHLFPRPGQRVLQVEVKDGASPVPPTRQEIKVHPDWHLLTTTPPDLHAPDTANILARDPATFSPGDLAGCYAVFGSYKAIDALTKLQPAATAQMKNIADADLAYMKTGIEALEPDLANAKATEPLLRALVVRCGAAPALVAMASWAKMNLAQLVLLTTDHTDEVKTLLAGVSVPSLVGDDHRRYDILRADLMVATGDVAGARKLYQDITGNPNGPDARSGVRQTGRIGQARVFLDRGDGESTEDALNQVAWESPIDKISPEWALTRLQLYQFQKLPDVALIYAKRLLPVITGGERSELLFQLTQLAADQGDHDLAGKTLAELLQKHAYSEEAAKAKAKWPGGV